MKRLCALLCSALMMLGLLGCGGEARREGFTVVATLFPQYDFARAIAGEHIQVSMLLPPGTESHVYDPSPSDMLAIAEADLFVYTGEHMEPWAHTVLEGVQSETLRVVDVSQGISLYETEEEHGHGHQHAYDPHIWMDPANAKQMVETIAQSFCELDPAHADTYRANAQAYLDKLDGLDADIRAVVDGAKRTTLVFGGRFALRYFVERYGLSYMAAYDACGEEAEPSPATVAALIDYVKTNGIPAVYYEELSEPRVANTIAVETGAEALLFHSAHNVTREQFEQGTTFLDIMYANLDSLKAGLQE